MSRCQPAGRRPSRALETFAEGTEPIGDKKGGAVELLEQFVDLND